MYLLVLQTCATLIINRQKIGQKSHVTSALINAHELGGHDDQSPSLLFSYFV